MGNHWPVAQQIYIVSIVSVPRAYEAVKSGDPLSFTFTEQLTAEQLAWLENTDVAIECITINDDDEGKWAEKVCNALPAQVKTLECTLAGRWLLFHVRLIALRTRQHALLRAYTLNAWL